MVLVRLFDEWAAFLPAGTLESFRADLGLTYAQAGAVLALVAPGALAGGLLTAATDRWSRRAIAAGGAFGFAASLAGFATGGSFPLLAAASFAAGVASTAMVDACEVALADLAGDGLRAFLARSNLLAALGGLTGPALVAATAWAGLSWRTGFWAGALVMAVYGAALAATPLPTPPRRPATRSGSSALAQVCADPRVWVTGLLSLVMAPFDEPLLGFTIARLERNLGTSTALATSVAFLAVGAELVAFGMVPGRLAKLDDHRVLAPSAVLATAGAALVAFGPAWPVVVAGTLVTATALALAWLALQHRILVLRPGQVGTTKAVVSTIEVAGLLVPAGVGMVADRLGLGAGLSVYVVLGLALSGLAVVARKLDA